MTTRLFHLRPANLVGDTLYPLNRLRELHPPVYAAHAAKYEGREAVMAVRIPLLDCLWNDVVQLCPVHPEQIRDAMKSAGFDWYPMRWMAIDPVANGFDASNTAIWTFPADYQQADPLRLEDLIPFSAAAIERMSHLPELAIAHYAESARSGARPLLFKNVPHVLHAGSIGLSAV